MYHLTEAEEEIGRLLVLAIRNVEGGKGISARVDAALEGTPAGRPAYTRRGLHYEEQIHISRQDLTEMFSKLGGATHVSRRLGVSASTLYYWRRQSRIPTWAHARLLAIMNTL